MKYTEEVAPDLKKTLLYKAKDKEELYDKVVSVFSMLHVYTSLQHQSADSPTNHAEILSRAMAFLSLEGISFLSIEGLQSFGNLCSELQHTNIPESKLHGYIQMGLLELVSRIPATASVVNLAEYASAVPILKEDDLHVLASCVDAAFLDSGSLPNLVALEHVLAQSSEPKRVKTRKRIRQRIDRTKMEKATSEELEKSFQILVRKGIASSIGNNIVVELGNRSKASHWAQQLNWMQPFLVEPYDIIGSKLDDKLKNAFSQTDYMQTLNVITSGLVKQSPFWLAILNACLSGITERVIMDKTPELTAFVCNLYNTTPSCRTPALRNAIFCGTSRLLSDGGELSPRHVSALLYCFSDIDASTDHSLSLRHFCETIQRHINLIPEVMLFPFCKLLSSSAYRDLLSEVIRLKGDHISSTVYKPDDIRDCIEMMSEFPLNQSAVNVLTQKFDSFLLPTMLQSDPIDVLKALLEMQLMCATARMEPPTSIQHELMGAVATCVEPGDLPMLFNGFIRHCARLQVTSVPALRMMMTLALDISQDYGDEISPMLQSLSIHRVDWDADYWKHLGEQVVRRLQVEPSPSNFDVVLSLYAASTRQGVNIPDLYQGIEECLSHLSASASPMLLFAAALMETEEAGSDFMNSVTDILRKCTRPALSMPPDDLVPVLESIFVALKALHTSVAGISVDRTSLLDLMRNVARVLDKVGADALLTAHELLMQESDTDEVLKRIMSRAIARHDGWKSPLQYGEPVMYAAIAAAEDPPMSHEDWISTMSEDMFNYVTREDIGKKLELAP